jgi:hypothetical protein
MNHHAILRGTLCLALGLGWALAAPGRLPASPELRKELKKIAVTIKKSLDEEGEKAVAIGQFVGPPQLAANPGPGLALLLTQELKDLGVPVKLRDANLYVAGEFRDVTDKDSRRLAVELRVKLMDRKKAKALDEWSCGILGVEAIGILTGANSALPDEEGPAPIQQLDRDLARPRLVVRNHTRLYAAEGRPFSMEILVGDRPRTLEIIEGLPFVSLRRQDIYVIRLNNDSDHDAAVKLCIDGIDIFGFNEDPEPDGKRRDYHVIVGKHSYALVKGWYRKNGVSDSFQVCEYSKSAAAKLLRSDPTQLGTITASFHACWPKGAARADKKSLSRAGDATGFGPPVREDYQTAEIVIGPPRDVLTVRYQPK